jgi:uncharacterized protein YoxC
VTAVDWVLIVVAVFWAVLVIFLALMLVNLVRVMESTRVLIEGIRKETVPLLGEVRKSVVGVNQELDRVDGIMASAGNISRSVERVTAVVERTVSSPLIKALAFSAGASKAFRRIRGRS